MAALEQTLSVFHVGKKEKYDPIVVDLIIISTLDVPPAYRHFVDIDRVLLCLCVIDVRCIQLYQAVISRPVLEAIFDMVDRIILHLGDLGVGLSAKKIFQPDFGGLFGLPQDEYIPAAADSGKKGQFHGIAV